MPNITTTVPDVVREIITQNRSIYDCMKMDLINYTALAVKIQPEVERQLGNRVNLNTIVVAIKRFADSFEQKEEVRKTPLLKDARLSLTDGIMDVRFSSDEFDLSDATSLMDKFSKIHSDYEFFRLADSFRILTEDMEDVRKLFESFPNIEHRFNTGLTRIKITIPDNQNRSDVGSYVANILHANGIEWEDAYFDRGTMIITLNSKDASRAYDVLRSEKTR
jgi:hypothetical protein